MKYPLTMLLALPVLWAGGAHGEPIADTAAATDTCVPAAVLSGEEELVAELGRELNLLGVSNRVAPNCPSVTASVEKSSTGVMVSLRQPDGRKATRSLSDTRIAATWIDSWLHEDLGAPLLAARLLPQPATPIISSPPPSAPVPTMTTPRSRLYQIGVGYETINRGQEASWNGLRARACMRLGPACAGVGVALSQSTSEAFEPNDISEFSQQAAELLAQVSVPFEVGQATVSPSLGLGAGWLRTQRLDDEFCFDENGDGTVSCVEPILGDQPNRRSSWSPVAEAGVGVALPIARSVKLELGGALGIRPFAASEVSFVDEFPPEPEPDVCIEPSAPDCADIPPAPSFLVLPAESSQAWRLSIGLQVDL